MILYILINLLLILISSNQIRIHYNSLKQTKLNKLIENKIQKNLKLKLDNHKPFNLFNHNKNLKILIQKTGIIIQRKYLKFLLVKLLLRKKVFHNKVYMKLKITNIIFLIL